MTHDHDAIGGGEDWRDKIADECVPILEHPVVGSAARELFEMLKLSPVSVEGMAIWKLMMASAQVALATERGIDPMTLALSPEESERERNHMKAELAFAGVDVSENAPKVRRLMCLKCGGEGNITYPMNIVRGCRNCGGKGYVEVGIRG